MPKADVIKLVDQGRIDEAWDVTGGIDDHNRRAEAALIIASSTGEEDHLQDALALASHVEDKDLRHRLETAVMNIMRSAGLVDF